MNAKEWRKGLTIGVLLLISAWLTSLIWGLIGKAHIAMSQERQARTEYEALETRKTELQANLTALDTDRGKDAAIRTAFGVARPGEEVIVVVPPPPAATTTSSWWDRFVGWFQ